MVEGDRLAHAPAVARFADRQRRGRNRHRCDHVSRFRIATAKPAAAEVGRDVGLFITPTATTFGAFGGGIRGRSLLRRAAARPRFYGRLLHPRELAQEARARLLL